MAESSGSEIVADLKDASPGVPVVVVQLGNSVPNFASNTVNDKNLELVEEVWRHTPAPFIGDKR